MASAGWEIRRAWWRVMGQRPVQARGRTGSGTSLGCAAGSVPAGMISQTVLRNSDASGRRAIARAPTEPLRKVV
jgi:hypothetical protein